MMRIALIGNAMDTMIRFRGPLIRDLARAGHEVIAVCPAGGSGDASEVAALGARHVALESLSRQGLDPRNELRLLAELTALLRIERPDRVFAYFLKPVIWGAIAARRAGVHRCVGMIEGMGYAFSAPTLNLRSRLRQKVARAGIEQLLRYALARIDHVFVLNTDDSELLNRRRLVDSSRLSLIDGIGVDLDHYGVAAPHVSPLRFTLPARLIREKGVDVFAQAASRVRSIYPGARFRLLGAVDTAPGALEVGQIESWVSRGIIEWPGEVHDVRPHLRETSVLVLPTLYSEGLPRSIMEAMAMGRPVITTNMPGARTSVTHGRSGIIVPAGKVDALVEACLRFCAAPNLIASMGRAARQEALLRYDVRRQNARQIAEILGSEPQQVHSETECDIGYVLGRHCNEVPSPHG